MTQTSGDAWPSAVDVDVDVDAGAGADDGFCIDVLVARLDGDEEIAREVAQAFVESTQELLQQLDDAISVGRHETVRLNAHSIKGAAANIGADALAETAAVIENAARDGQLTVAEQASPQLHQRIDRVFKVLEAWV